MVKREESYFTMIITWQLWDFSWWGGMRHVSPWASRGDHEISDGEEGGVIFPHEHHVTTMRFLMVKRKESYFTLSITWRPWDFSWGDGMSHVSPWASRGDHEISHGEEGGVIFHHEHHVTTMRFLMVRWDEPCFTMSITWWPWDFSWWRGRSHISPWALRGDHEKFHGVLYGEIYW